VQVKIALFSQEKSFSYPAVSAGNKRKYAKITGEARILPKKGSSCSFPYRQLAVVSGSHSNTPEKTQKQ